MYPSYINKISEISFYGLKMLYSLSAICLILPLSTNIQSVSSAGIDCFKCVSTNGSNPLCEDPFHNNYTSNILERPCMGGRKGRNGLFPASACIKVAGTYADGSGSIMIRGCSLDSGTLTVDTELVRMSHCGSFFFNEKYVHGCVMSCDDVDACNSATQTMDNNLFKTTSSLPFITKYLVLIVLARTVNTTFLPRYINT